jgi:hypothetical protein
MHLPAGRSRLDSPPCLPPNPQAHLALATSLTVHRRCRILEEVRPPLLKNRTKGSFVWFTVGDTMHDSRVYSPSCMLQRFVCFPAAWGRRRWWRRWRIRNHRDVENPRERGNGNENDEDERARLTVT